MAGSQYPGIVDLIESLPEVGAKVTCKGALVRDVGNCQRQKKTSNRHADSKI